MLHLGEGLLDWIEIGRIRRQERELGARVEDRPAHSLRTVAAEIVENDDVATTKRWDQELIDVSAEDFAVDWTIDHTRLGQSIDPESCEEGQRVPASVGRKTRQALALWPPAADRGHVGFDPGLIDEDETLSIEMAACSPPTFTPPDDVVAMLLDREERFF